MDVFAELERQIKEGKKKLKKREQAPAKDAAFLAQAVTIPKSAEAGSFSLSSVFSFLRHLRKEPREILEVRYQKMLGVVPPREARHEWLVHSVAYEYQDQCYRSFYEGAVPTYVLTNHHNHKISYAGPRAGEAYDLRDPSPKDEDPGVEIWDDTRVAATGANPYARGKSHDAFFTVQMAGAEGINFEPLVKTIEGVLECTTGNAQDWAYEMFTKKVREGFTKIILL